MRITFSAPCPHCGKVVAFPSLRRIPFAGKLKWYQFTPAPQLACSNCGGLVRSSAANSPWLLLAFTPILIILAGIFFPPIAFLSRGLWVLAPLSIFLLGVWGALRKVRLLPR